MFMVVGTNAPIFTRLTCNYMYSSYQPGDIDPRRHLHVKVTGEIDTLGQLLCMCKDFSDVESSL